MAEPVRLEAYVHVAGKEMPLVEFVYNDVSRRTPLAIPAYAAA